MKVRPILFALAATAACAAAGQAAAQTPGGQRDCFYSRNINGFTAVDDETVNIRVGVRDVYQLKLFAPSTDIKWAQGIALVSRGGSFICSRLDADVVVPSTVGGAQRFPVTSIRHLTREEAAALPKNQRP
jgi:hypothetical protein